MSSGTIVTFVLALVVVAGPVFADAERISARSDFVDMIDGQSLSRIGIRLEVTSDGVIRGRAFGRPVSGRWRWQDGFFCRDLYWGEQDLGPNCQTVSVRGDVVRFTSDKGRGDHADLTLR